MGNWRKYLCWILVATLLALVALGLLVKLYVTPERVRSLLQSGLESSLQRKVQLGEVKVGLFRGIQLDALHVTDLGGDEELLAAEDIELEYDILALLTGQIHFGRILIRRPQLRLERFADGRLNIADFLGGKPDPNRAARPEIETGPGNESTRFTLVIGQFVLQEGSLIFIDRKLRGDSPYLHRLEKLNIDIENFSLEDTFRAKLAVSINDAPLKADLQFSFDEGVQSLTLKADQVGLAPFVPYFQEFFPGRLAQGNLSTALHLEKESAGVVLKGQIVLDDLDFTLETTPSFVWKNLRFATDQDLWYRPVDHILEVRKFQIEGSGFQASYSGKVALRGDHPLAGTGRIQIPELREALALLPLEWREQLEPFSLAGGLTAVLHLEGPATEAQVVTLAELTFTGLQTSIGSLRPELNGKLDYADQRIEGKDLILDLKGQPLSMDLNLTGPLSQQPEAQIRLHAARLDLTSLFPETPANSAAAVPQVSSAGAEQGPSREPLVLPLTAQVALSFDELDYRGLSFTALEAHLQLLKDQVQLTSLSAQLGGGELELSGDMSLSDPRFPYQGQFNVARLELAPVADALLPEGKGSIRGKFLTATSFSGQAGPADLLSNLHASGPFEIRDGEISGSPLFAGLAGFLTNPEFELLGFSRFHGIYSLKGKQGTIDARLESRRSILAPKGTFSLAGPLNLHLETRVAPELMAKSGVGGKGAELLRDDQGWTLLPLRVKGTYGQPRFSLDSSATGTQLRKGLVRELEKELLKNTRKKGAPETQKPIQQLLDGTLQKLFGN